MKPTNVLLLNLNQSRELSDSLRGIIESNKDADLRVRLETIDNNPQSDRVGNGLREIVSRISPAVIFLVSSWNYLKQAGALFSSLRGFPAHPPVVVVSDAAAPDEMLEIINLGAADFITPPLKPIEIIPRLWRLLANKAPEKSGNRSSGSPAHSMLRTSRPLIGSSRAFLEVVAKIPQLA